MPRSPQLEDQQIGPVTLLTSGAAVIPGKGNDMPKYRPEPERFFEKVERRADGCWIWTAGISQGTGYGTFKLARTRKHIGAHRWSYQYHKGEIPTGMHIDHTCHTHACVNPDHLRLATPAENQQNQNRLNRQNTTGYRGVWFCKRTQRFGAQIVIDQRKKFLGRYATAEEAAEVAREARLLAYTHNDADRHSDKR